MIFDFKHIFKRVLFEKEIGYLCVVKHEYCKGVLLKHNYVLNKRTLLFDEKKVFNVSELGEEYIFDSYEEMNYIVDGNKKYRKFLMNNPQGIYYNRIHFSVTKKSVDIHTMSDKILYVPSKLSLEIIKNPC